MGIFKGHERDEDKFVTTLISIQLQAGFSHDVVPSPLYVTQNRAAAGLDTSSHSRLRLS